MSIEDIPKFEKQNPDIALNILTCDEDGGNLRPIRVTHRRDVKAINLLLIQSGEIYHWTLIKNLNRLLRKSNDTHSREFCPNCLKGLDKRTYNQNQIEEHVRLCYSNEPAKVILPEIGKNIAKYKDHKKQIKAPFVAYADFESLIKKDSEDLSIHEISGYSICVKYTHQDKQTITSYRGEDAGEHFLEHIKCMEKDLKYQMSCANADMIYMYR